MGKTQQELRRKSNRLQVFLVRLAPKIMEQLDNLQLRVSQRLFTTGPDKRIMVGQRSAMVGVSRRQFSGN